MRKPKQRDLISQYEQLRVVRPEELMLMAGREVARK